ncbi:MAG: sugar kinase [Phycisphaeraceae bacterium]|nr:sugar kinase [Phycisphaeraceae bacterium]MCW5754926.1 sugar kinase [Phycisphaeraceae bacterium]
MALVVTGTISIDTIHTPSGEVRPDILGGSCTYFAAAASFFTPVRMVAVVGQDFPPHLRATLDRFPNIDTRGLEVRAGSKSFRWGGRYLDNMDQRETVFTDLNVIAEAPPPVPEAYRDSPLVFLANTHPAIQMHMLEHFDRRILAVADTMDLWINHHRDDLLALLRRVDGLVLNYDEAELMTGKRNTVAAARALLAHGPRFVVVKKGEHGCILAHQDGLAALPAYPAENVIDPTGAGDTFAGGMMGHLARRLAEGKEIRSFEAIRQALAHGTIVASFTIEDFSLDRLARLTAEDIRWRTDEFARMLRMG